MNRTTAMAEATRLTREGRLAEATALIRRTLDGRAPDVPPAGRAHDGSGDAGPGDDGRSAKDGLRALLRRLGRARSDAPAGEHPRPQRPPRVDLAAHPDLSALRDLPGLANLPGLAHGLPAGPVGRALPGTTSVHVHRGPAGERPYTLYVPSTATGAPAPLVVMLHGGTQTAAAFAAATRMNELAEEHGFLVVWPEQVTSANAMRYWNWFRPGDQQRSGGEPELLAGIVAQVAAGHPVDRSRVYVAGFSAGAAMAAVLAVTHPDVFAAVGVHSGLPHGCAHDTGSAFAVMRQPSPARRAPRAVPVITFHGDADAIVDAGNAARVVEQLSPAGPLVREIVRVAEGRAASRTLVRRDGAVVAEQWTVHGSGHAWSGGAQGGSYTDPAGPDASAEMVRFFAEHSRRA